MEFFSPMIPIRATKQGIPKNLNKKVVISFKKGREIGINNGGQRTHTLGAYHPFDRIYFGYGVGDIFSSGSVK